MRKNKSLLIGLLLGGFFAMPAVAHRVGMPVSSIEWNDRSTKWEITHRLSAHDLEKALGPDVNLASLSDEEYQKIVGEYVQSKFFVLINVVISVILFYY